MGRVVVEVTIEILEDLWAVRRGALPDDQVRRIVVADALVDTGATLLSLPTRVIQALGLQLVLLSNELVLLGIQLLGLSPQFARLRLDASRLQVELLDRNVGCGRHLAAFRALYSAYQR